MHSPLIRAAASCVLLASLVAASLWWFASPEEPEYGGQWHERQLVYLFEVANQTGEMQSGRTLDVFVPPDIEGRQQRLDIVADRPYELFEVPGGNIVARIELGDVPPWGSRTIRLRTHLEVMDRASSADIAFNGTLNRSVRFPVDHPEIVERVEALQASDAMSTMRNVYDWVGHHMEDIGYVRRDRGALYALREGKGDCTEYMSLTSALALSAGVPVRAVGGFDYDSDRVARAAEFHNWVEAHIDGQWWIVDAQFEDFTPDTGTRVIVRQLTDRETTDINSQGLYSPLADFDVSMH